MDETECAMIFDLGILFKGTPGYFSLRIFVSSHLHDKVGLDERDHRNKDVIMGDDLGNMFCGAFVGSILGVEAADQGNRI